MLTEIERHNEILGRLVVNRLNLEKQWFHVDQETPVTLIDSMTFEMKCLDTMLVRMVRRGRLINPEMEEYTHRALTMVSTLLYMEREAYPKDMIEKRHLA